MIKDFNSMSKAKFWKLVDNKGEEEQANFIELWDKLHETVLEPEEAASCLNSLFVFTHMRIREYSNKLAAHYPTKQYTNDKLVDKNHLWWVDHFTAGISRWSTLSWFSSKKREKKSGKKGYAGASTHFIQGYHDYPFYIIALNHGAWHEPQRNKDSISVEMVNAGGLHRNDRGRWCYWARELPETLVRELPPVLLDKPYRGLKVMQPFTVDQVINNIKLKRLVTAALNPRLDMARMSQHSDWRKGKTDMGVLWPFSACNEAAFAPDPIAELDFVQSYDDFLGDAGTQWDETTGFIENEEDNPGYSTGNTADVKALLSIKDVQSALVRRGYNLVVDGVMGTKTRIALKDFQHRWNGLNSREPKLVVDGIPGPQTCEKLT